jgi:hypothetical protein
MYAYFNDLSMEMPIGQSKDAWPLLNEIIAIASTLSENYSIDFIKVPDDFQSKKIANTHSIDDLLIPISEELAAIEASNDYQQAIIDFLANRTWSNVEEIEAEILKEIDNKNTWIEVKYSGQYSQFLTGAYLLGMPAISLKTKAEFEVDNLSCQYSIQYFDTEKSTNRVKDVVVMNIYSNDQIAKHHPYLVKIKGDIVFGKGQWNPYKNPIWNDKTASLLKEMGFPQSIEKKKDKKSELMEVGEKVAILNCWRLSKEVTTINSNSGQIRVVFISNSNHRHAYLSIDMKNAYGRFEYHDDKGRHTGEIDFATGNYIPRGTSQTGKDTKGQHDLKLKR